MRIQTNTVLAFCLVAGGASSLFPNEPPPQPRIVVAVAELRSAQVVIIGELGLPLGTPVEVEGVLTPPRRLSYSSHATEIWLAIDTIDGKKLASPKEFPFRVEAPHLSKFENSQFEFKKLLDGLVEDNALTSEEGEKILKEYTKVRRKLRVFETACFIGRPAGLPQGKMMAIGPTFKIETSLVVITPEE